jgi:hypothetical protein
MTIEDKIRKIADAPIREVDFQDSPDQYFYELCVKAYNLGIETAANNSNVIFHGDPIYHAEVDKKKILKLKINGNNI